MAARMSLGISWVFHGKWPSSFLMDLMRISLWKNGDLSRTWGCFIASSGVVNGMPILGVYQCLSHESSSKIMKKGHLASTFQLPLKGLLHVATTTLEFDHLSHPTPNAARRLCRHLASDRDENHRWMDLLLHWIKPFIKCQKDSKGYRQTIGPLKQSSLELFAHPQPEKGSMHKAPCSCLQHASQPVLSVNEHSTVISGPGWKLATVALKCRGWALVSQPKSPSSAVRG